MHFEYTLTIDDFAQSMEPVNKQGKVQRVKPGIFGWLIFTLLMIGWNFKLGLQNGGGWLDRTLPSQNLWVTLASPMVTAGMLTAAILFGMFDNWRRTRIATANNSSPTDLPRLKWISLIVFLPMTFMIVPNVPAWTVYWHPAPGAVMWVSLLPWIGFAFVLGATGPLRRRWGTSKQFAQRRSMRRTINLDVTADAVVVDDGHSYARLLWPAFDRYTETERVLKLVTEDEGFVIIPKHEVIELGQLEALRSLVQTKIAKGTFLARDFRFPVVPTPVVSMPVESIDSQQN